MESAFLLIYVRNEIDHLRGGWLAWLPWLYKFWLIRLSMFMRLLVNTPSKFTELSLTGCRLLLVGLVFRLICCCCWV